MGFFYFENLHIKREPLHFKKPRISVLLGENNSRSTAHISFVTEFQTETSLLATNFTPLAITKNGPSPLPHYSTESKQ